MDKNLGWLMVDNARLLRRAFDERVRAIGITGPQARLLLALERSPGENQAFHAERLEVEGVDTAAAVIQELRRSHPGVTLSGWTMDQANAYKQRALKPADQ